MSRGEVKRPPRARRGGEVVRAPDLEPEIVALGRERQRQREARELSAARAEIEVLQKELADARLNQGGHILDPIEEKPWLIHCAHHSVEVVEMEGVVRCKGCKVELDPIQVLLWYARGDRTVLNQDAMVAAELRRRRTELENVERKLANVKAALRRHAPRARGLGLAVDE